MSHNETNVMSAVVVKHETPELSDLIYQTDKLFLQPDFAIKEPDSLWKDKISEVEKANMAFRASGVLFDMRVEQAKELGFIQVSEEDITHDLMGETHNRFESGGEDKIKMTYEWSYNHHTDEVEENVRSTVPKYYSLVEKRTPWYLPPFSKTLQWTVVSGPLKHYLPKIPHEMVQRLNRCKNLKLFNCLMAFAPKAAFVKNAPQPTIMVARISEFRHLSEKEGYNLSGEQAGHQAYFFLGHWK